MLAIDALVDADCGRIGDLVEARLTSLSALVTGRRQQKADTGGRERQSNNKHKKIKRGVTKRPRTVTTNCCSVSV